jgi:hypothetical protein
MTHPEYQSHELEAMHEESFSSVPGSKSLSLMDHQPSQAYPTNQSSDQSYRRFHFKQNALMPFYPKSI